MIDDIDQLVTSAVTDVFGTMLKIPVQMEPVKAAIRANEPHVAGSVGFIGPLNGVVYVYSTEIFARKMTRVLLGYKDKEPGDEMVNDAMGEITNMIVGSIKSKLSDRGMSCALTIPSIVRGSNFSIQPTSCTQRRLCAYECQGNQIVVEVLLKPMSKEVHFAV